MKFAVGSSTAEWGKIKGHVVHFVNQCESTNAVARSLPQQLDPMQLIVTNHQTAGRGRSQNQWLDQKNDSLLASWVFDIAQTPMPVTSCRIGLAVVQSLKTTWPWMELSLKAPNDIYLRDKKVGGILIENIQQGFHNRFIVGIGMNVFSTPNIANSTCLTDSANDIAPLSLFDWYSFLEDLTFHLKNAARQNPDLLSYREQAAILYYLNLNPALSEPFHSLSQDGNLKSSTREIQWSEL